MTENNEQAPQPDCEVDGLMSSLRLHKKKKHPSSTDGSDPYTYRMNRKPRGKFILINNEKFDNLSERTGTQMDGRNLKRLFGEKLGFDVLSGEGYDNLTAIKMLRVMEEVGVEDHSSYDCIAVAVLTHGHVGVLCGVDYKKKELGPDGEVLVHERGTITLEQFAHPIKTCESLNGKPKLFFIQACRGDELDPGTWMRKDSHEASADKYTEYVRIPQEADFLFAYSTASGYASVREYDKGSWFVQSLYSVFNEQALNKVSILSMLTHVNRKVAHDFNWNNKKQISSFVSQLTKELYFC